MDTSLGQPPFQRLPPHIRITPAARITAYVDDDIDSRVLEKPAERGPIQVPMSYSQQTQHLSIIPAGNSHEVLGQDVMPYQAAGRVHDWVTWFGPRNLEVVALRITYIC